MGSTLNAAIKTLANGSSLAYTYQDHAVTKIVFKVNQDLSGLTGGVDVSTPKDGSVILTFDGGVATISTNYQKLRSNDNISYTFRDFRELTRVEGFELIDTRNATNARNLVYCAMKLEYINISQMNTSNITNMTSMFCDAPALTQEVFDFSNWDTRNVETMNYMFDSVSVQTLDLSTFDMKKVTTMAFMFTNCFNLKNLNISSFNTANVTTFDNMFEDCQNLTSLDLRHFVTTKVTDLRSFCNRCYALKTIDLSSFNTKGVGRFSWMFNDCQELETIIVGPNFSGDKATTLQETFRNCFKLKSIDMSNFVTSSTLTTCALTFYECNALQSVDLSKLVTTNVTSFSRMFYNCKAITSIDMGNATCKGLNPDGSNANYNNTGGFYYMFYGCNSLEYLDIRSFVYPGKTTYMHMFEGCVNMKTLHIDELGDISTYRYVNDYNLSVGSITDGTLLGYNATPESPCVIYSNSAVLIRMLMFNRNYNNTGQYMNYGYAIRQYCGAGKIVFKKTGFNNPWTFTGWDPATATGAPTLDNIVAPTE